MAQQSSLPESRPEEVVDVLIIGGSHAGLSAALTLYRGLHTCIIFDSSRPRTRSADGSTLGRIHLTPTWEHSSPEAMKAASRKELSEFGSEFISFVDDVEIKSVRKRSDGLFEASSSQDGSRKWTGRKLLLATGARDVFPVDLPGYGELYARGMYVGFLFPSYS